MNTKQTEQETEAEKIKALVAKSKARREMLRREMAKEKF